MNADKIILISIGCISAWIRPLNKWIPLNVPAIRTHIVNNFEIINLLDINFSKIYSPIPISRLLSLSLSVSLFHSFVFSLCMQPFHTVIQSPRSICIMCILNVNFWMAMCVFNGLCCFVVQTSPSLPPLYFNNCDQIMCKYLIRERYYTQKQQTVDCMRIK